MSWSSVWRVAVTATVAVVVVVAVVRGFFADPNAQDLLFVLGAPSWDHPFGTDALGRDVWTRVVHGAVLSLGVAWGGVALALVVGSSLGAVAALGPRWGRRLVLAGADLILAFPSLLATLLIAALFGGHPLVLGGALGFSLIPLFVRLTVTVVADHAGRPAFEASRLAGLGIGRCLVRHVVPAWAALVLPQALLQCGSGVLTVSALGFLGLGVPPPATEWGALVGELLPYASEAPWTIVGPSLVIGLLVVAGHRWAERLNHREEP